MAASWQLKASPPLLPPWPLPGAAASRGLLICAPLPHDTQPTGAAFFRRRLQRAAAIPPEQRDPVVHAFVASVE